MTCIVQATMKDDRLDSLASADGLPMHTVPSAILQAVLQDSTALVTSPLFLYQSDSMT